MVRKAICLTTMHLTDHYESPTPWSGNPPRPQIEALLDRLYVQKELRWARQYVEIPIYRGIHNVQSVGLSPAINNKPVFVSLFIWACVTIGQTPRQRCHRRKHWSNQSLAPKVSPASNLPNIRSRICESRRRPSKSDNARRRASI